MIWAWFPCAAVMPDSWCSVVTCWLASLQTKTVDEITFSLYSAVPTTVTASLFSPQ